MSSNCAAHSIDDIIKFPKKFEAYMTLNRLLLPLGLFVATFAEGAKSESFSSSYTNLATDCKSESSADAESKGQDPVVTCKGFGGYYLKINFTATNSYLLVERLKSVALSTISVPLKNYDKGSVEWRNFKGKPFAIVVRSQEIDAGTQKPGIESLVVKGLTGFEYIDFTVKANDPKANEKARVLADSAKASHP
jgi:hypothetical protein